ncbi:hypothetical protein ILFOPFJJ_00262 [Ensifer psoraleae]|nr:hypothetical protein [Sinorhizobium psoraleae]
MIIEGDDFYRGVNNRDGLIGFVPHLLRPEGKVCNPN